MKQMQNIRSEIVTLIRDVCMKLTGHARENEVRLLLGTAAAESGFIFRKQLDDGPARGLWQMEPGMTGAEDIFKNWLAFNPVRCVRLTRLWFDMERPTFVDFVVAPDVGDIAHHLEVYDDFACAMARIKYLRDPDPIPTSLSAQAAYWKRIYNTPAGAGTPEHYLEMWYSLKCEELMV